MLTKYINNLINELPPQASIEFDLILGPGLFNGSYLLGSLLYLKHLSIKKYIVINRISGCSIGSLIALLWFIDENINNEIYAMLYSILKQNKKNIFDKFFTCLFNKLKTYITPLILESINNHLYITYHNLKKNKQIIKSKYKNVNDLFESIHKSCYIPYIIGPEIVYKDKFMDGVYPYIFKNTKCLYISSTFYNYTNNNIIDCISIKNQSSNYNRIFYGMIDIHNFFMYSENTEMCSFVDKWTFIDHFKYNITINVLVHLVYIFQILFKFEKLDNKLKPRKHKWLHVIYYYIKTLCI